jgi:hypothetical protein
MLQRRQITEMIKEINLPENGYWISSGAALVLHGVKDATNDIDLGCTSELFESLLKRGYTYKVLEDNTRVITISDWIEILENWTVDNIELIHGLPVASLESIKKQKAQLAREKDFKDIKLIDDYIKSKDK